MRVALFEPDIPQNAGTLMRLSAALGVPMDLIEPAGFVLDDRRLGRALMDYAERLDLTRHDSWRAFEAWRRRLDARPRLLLMTTQGAVRYTDFAYRDGDILLAGRESAGVPEAVHDAADARLIVPMIEGARALNVATATAMVLGEALRQTRWRGEES